MKWLKNLLPKVTSAEGDMNGFFEQLEAEKPRKAPGARIYVNGKVINFEEVTDTAARLKALEGRVAALEAERDGR